MTIEEINEQINATNERLEMLEAELKGLKGRILVANRKIDEEVKTRAKLKKVKELFTELEL